MRRALEELRRELRPQYMKAIDREHAIERITSLENARDSISNVLGAGVVVASSLVVSMGKTAWDIITSSKGVAPEVRLAVSTVVVSVAYVIVLMYKNWSSHVSKYDEAIKKYNERVEDIDGASSGHSFGGIDPEFARELNQRAERAKAEFDEQATVERYRRKIEAERPTPVADGSDDRPRVVVEPPMNSTEDDAEELERNETHGAAKRGGS